MQHVGIIGAGLVGSAIAENLLAAGYRVSGYDLDAARRSNLERLGGVAMPSGAEVFAACERVILSLPTSAIARSVIAESMAHLQRGSLVIDTTTGAPGEVLDCAHTLAAAGVDYVDATIGGSSRQVRNRECIFICGGTAEALARCADVFDLCSRRTFHVGPVGSGARMKLVLNLVLGLNRAVLAEGLEFARTTGIDPHAALEILKAGPTYARVMDTKGTRMLDQSFEPEARLSQHLKDVRLILESGAAAGMRLPLSEVHRELLEAAERAGFGAADNCAVIMAYR